ncbi:MULTISPECIES: cobyrinate a,c-diamide synthase [Marichromatium]|uniref:Cobyrinate a,c-diamide synthase n=1 Tax=Marichromatium gracile TaxID=1048 RepID=A0A4R4A9L4_MARGR|nr:MULTISPECIES: cobyrinate a,c-diamide synthase [Marichromatium]MBO8085036.1 cobyrinate a,c-diamide synthase [Marichromatium sp.]MBK1708487.1 cobyrinic acid a,c-diamide synthase [Marichromatium gracile]RNE89960.1 cobyrinate a,c-diamide synthase [Marichromatium sp. AB31]RNE94163.1 cobyrinate a,c-diamide synthase [Marichromatium sp. AB32]TCW35623.1 hydrogenobyrinic acid a,c-diamide synthase (glutamine-hydrolysing) /cobyrinate a,c-diamide synthase [Marichromatium gracile]
MAHLYLSAPQKSSGKTTLAIGLCRALRGRGLAVQPFKKGPDYIDPLWLSQAAGRLCLNLDFNTMDRAEILAAFGRECAGADVALIEGNMGLFDDTALDGANSNAALARALAAPVVLVVNCQGMGRGIAPLLLGYQTFDPGLRLAGVVLNRVGSARHAAGLVRAVEHYTDLPVLGVIERDAALAIDERHLGLMPSIETASAESTIDTLARRVAEQLDLDQLLALAESAPVPPAPPPEPAVAPHGAGLRIGIARDAVFGFYYPDDLRALARAGAELVPFSPLVDAELPAVDALFIGGGFPELRMAELEANRTLRAQIAEFVAAGRPVYAECGGLMYLCAGLHWRGERRAMVGALAAEVMMHPRPQGRGLVRLRETGDHPWPGGGAGRELAAHEFHHSALIAPDPGWRYGFEVVRGSGIDGRHDGVVQQRLLACYSHLRDVGGSGWTGRFLRQVARSLGGP